MNFSDLLLAQQTGLRRPADLATSAALEGAVTDWMDALGLLAVPSVSPGPSYRRIIGRFL